MYKVASSNRQAALTRGTLADWQNGIEPDLSDEARLAIARDQYRVLSERLTKFTKRDPEYGPLRDNLMRVHAVIVEAKAKLGIGAGRRHTREFSSIIAEVAKEHLTKPQWMIVMKEARERYDRMLAEATDAIG
jgi:hypothetical protein